MCAVPSSMMSVPVPQEATSYIRFGTSFSDSMTQVRPPALRESLWGLSNWQNDHVFAVTLLVGTISILDLRLFGHNPAEESRGYGVCMPIENSVLRQIRGRDSIGHNDP